MRIALALLCLSMPGCSATGGCEDRLLEAKADLAGPLVAYRYVRSCGATAGGTMNVAVGARGGGFAGAERVFTADASSANIDTDRGELWVEMHWTDPHRLSIAYAEGARVFLARDSMPYASVVSRATARSVHIPSPMVTHDVFSPPRPIPLPRIRRPRSILPFDPPPLTPPTPSADTMPPGPREE